MDTLFFYDYYDLEDYVSAKVPYPELGKEFTVELAEPEDKYLRELDHLRNAGVEVSHEGVKCLDDVTICTEPEEVTPETVDAGLFHNLNAKYDKKFVYSTGYCTVKGTFEYGKGDKKISRQYDYTLDKGWNILDVEEPAPGVYKYRNAEDTLVSFSISLDED